MMAEADMETTIPTKYSLLGRTNGNVKTFRTSSSVESGRQGDATGELRPFRRGHNKWRYLSMVEKGRVSWVSLCLAEVSGQENI